MNCNECTEEIQEARGCYGGVVWEIGTYEHDGCPEHLVNENLWLINMWSDWKIFGFPFPGHHSEQPKYIIETIRTLQNEMIKIDKEK